MKTLFKLILLTGTFVSLKKMRVCAQLICTFTKDFAFSFTSASYLCNPEMNWYIHLIYLNKVKHKYLALVFICFVIPASSCMQPKCSLHSKGSIGLCITSLSLFFLYRYLYHFFLLFGRLFIPTI